MRIASLLSAATEMLFALGLGDQVVAVSHECDWPPAACSLPRATFSRIDSSQPSAAIDVQVRSLLAAGEPLYEVDAELLARLRPELIVTQAQCDVCAIRYDDVRRLVADRAELAGARIVALNPTSLADILHDLERIAAAANRPETAGPVVADLRRRLDRVAEATAAIPLTQRPRVAVIEWIEPLMLAGNWAPEVVELAGGVSLVETRGEHSRYWAWDELIAAAPDAIVVAPCGFDLARSHAEARRLADFPGWSALPAVRRNQVHVIDGNAYLNRSGPRMVDTVEIMHGLLRDEGNHE